jgi:hypothetical protein
MFGDFDLIEFFNLEMSNENSNYFKETRNKIQRIKWIKNQSKENFREFFVNFLILKLVLH